jgi:hypothetical protein
MTVAEWLSCTDPQAMLKFLQSKASDRKLRLFAVACCRDIWELIPGEAGRNAVKASEEYADGRIRRKDLTEMRQRARREESTLAHWAAMAVSRPAIAAGWVAHLAADAEDRQGIHHLYAPTAKPSPRQCHHLRDIFGPLPFRPVSINPTWLTPTVTNLAQAAYDNRILPAGTLDAARLAVLADALLDAGCTDTDILRHLRGPGPHVRGCWAVDLLLAKE